MTYTCLESRRDDLTKIVNRLQRKAQRHNAQFAVSFGNPYPVSVNVNEYDEINHCLIKRDPITVEAFDITINAEIIGYSDYTVVAMIEHGENANIVHTFDNTPSLDVWHTIPAKCEHCKGSHNQKTTFIVRDINGTDKQVGKTCLKEYTGINPETILSANEINDILIKESPYNAEIDVYSLPRVYNTIDCIAHAIAVYRAQGYVKSGCVNANKTIINKNLIDNVRPTETDYKQAQTIAEAVENMNVYTAQAYLLDNVQALVKNKYCKLSYIGYVAYAPVAYEKYIKDTNKKEAEKVASDYVGTVGKRDMFQIASCELVTSWPNQYGITYLYKFVDMVGNTLVWYASKSIDTACKCIKATVKEHSEYNGIKQTIITRCSIC